MEQIKPRPVDNFVNYLSTNRKIITDTNNTSLHLVLGNESCDLDSMVSALTYAYFLQVTKYKNSCNVKALPILNIKTKDINLRTENCYLLKQLNVSVDGLVFRDSIDLQQFKSSKELKITLVDHHVLNQNDLFLEDNVVEIFDHRPKDPNFKFNLSETDCKILQVGSCCTLIAQEILKGCSSIFTDSLLLLLYNTIIFDTIGFKPSAGKAKELDFKIIEELERLLHIKPEDRSDNFSNLWKVHNDVSHLSPKELLYKDLKVIKNVQIPGLPMLVKNYLHLSGAKEGVEEFMKENIGCRCVLLIGLEATVSDVERDLAIFPCGKDDFISALIKELLDEKYNLKLEETDVTGILSSEVRHFKQKNVKASRKQIIPVVKEVVEMFKD